MYRCANIHVFADSSLPADYAVIFVEAASLIVLPDGKTFKPHLCRLRGPNCLIPSPFSAFIECFAFEKTPRDAFALARCGMGYKSE